MNKIQLQIGGNTFQHFIFYTSEKYSPQTKQGPKGGGPWGSGKVARF